MLNNKTQREEAINMYKGENPFARSFKVHVEALPNEKGFVDLGFGNVELNSHEFVLRMQDVKGEKMTLRFPHHIRESLQTEYDYRNKGMCIVLSTRDCCYYLYSEEKEFQVTELQFISEYLFQNS